MNITSEYLHKHPNEIYVFSDDKEHLSNSSWRLHVNAYGFVTRKGPDTPYALEDYEKVFYSEAAKLNNFIHEYPTYKFLISKLGSELPDNTNKIFQEIIEPKIFRVLSSHNNVEFLWKPEIVETKWWGYVDRNLKPNVFMYKPDFNSKEDPAFEAAKKSKYVLRVFGPFTSPSKDKAVTIVSEKFRDNPALL